MAKTISQRISIEGSEDIRKKLQELGAAGEKAFKQIQDAAKKPITDPAQVDKTKQAVDQLVAAVGKLSPQFKQVNAETDKFGATAPQAFQTTAAEANKLGVRVGVVAGLVAALTSKLIGLAGQVRSALSPGEALKGTVETGKAIADQAAKLKLTVPEWLKLSKAIAAAGVSEEAFIKGTSKLAGIIADAKGGFVELVPGQLVSTSKGAVAVMSDLAKSISMLGNSAEAARQGTAAFGENWKEIVKALVGGKAAANAAEDVFDKLAKVDRAMGPDQAAKAAQLAKGWDVLGKAIRAAKDQIGTVLLDTALLKAEWMIRLIDGARELFKTWQQLAVAKQAAFLEGLGETGPELLFKTLLQTGELLGQLWDNVLVPAGEALLGVFTKISTALGDIPKGNVIAFFITAAIAAAGLALALKAIGFLLAPLSLLAALFSPFGAALLVAAAAAFLFWDKLKAGATQVAALIPAELAQIGEAIKKLFSGDFAGFWDQFSAAAMAAFEKISQAAQQTPWVQSLISGFKQIAADLPGAIELIIQAFIGLGRAAQGVADAINFIFGTRLTGTDIGLIVIIGQITGAFSLLAVAAGIAAAAVAVFGGPVTIAILAAAAAAGLLVQYWPQIRDAAVAAFDAVIGGISGLIAKIGELASAIGGAIWDTFASAGQAAINLVTGAIDGLIGKLKAAWEWASKLFSSGGGGTPAGAAPGFARGGTVGGRGSGTSDSNLAWVSRGEHIMPARSVRQPGVLAFLEALRRSGGDLSRVLDRMGHFATGGLVTMPAFAAGGSVGGMSHVTIAFPGMPAIGGLRAPSDVVEQLQRAAAMAQVRSGGRKPSRYS